MELIGPKGRNCTAAYWADGGLRSRPGRAHLARALARAVARCEDLGQNASHPSRLPDLSIKGKFGSGHVFEGGCHEGEDYGTPGTSPGVTWARSPCRVLRSSSGMPIGP